LSLLIKFHRRAARARNAFGALLAFAPLVAIAQEATNETVVVSADRLPGVEAAAAFTTHVLESDELRRAPELRLDDILRAEVPGFSLFRRNSSRTANPTTQGVTLRNFGPSGAGRTLVLLDGIPQNDPFAGYVLWSQLPTSAINSLVVQPGGGAGLFGNAALAGTIFLVSKPIDETTESTDVTLGNRSTYDVAADASFAQQPLALGIFADRFSTGGYPVIRENQRGPVDTNAHARADVIDGRAELRIDDDTSVRLRGRWFDDLRGNGTRYTSNRSEGEDGSAVLTRKFPDEQAELELSIYGQLRRFRSTFSSINSTRTIETPALDQFNVPADALGGSAVWSMAVRDHLLTFGADARNVSGETDELFSWNGSRFTRLREAGGEQLYVGAFAQDGWSASTNLTVVGAIRYDRWQLADGFRRETVRSTGAVLTDSHFPDRDGDEYNGRLGARLAANDAIAFRAASYSGFRVPTLNELYRPFRVGNDVTEANPALKPEEFIGVEGAIELQPTRTLQITATGFYNRMRDAVGNITIGFGPGTFTPGGFIPRGGVLRQRENVDLVTAPGFETQMRWQAIATLSVRANYLFTRPTIDRAAERDLEGNLLAQTPEHVVTAGVDWRPVRQWTLDAQMRYSSRQFEDDQNSRVLAPYATVDLAVIYEFSERISAAVRVENLFDKEIETGKSADGLVSIGAPRFVSLQLRWQL
jgi:outer membrane receptor protein involved in Fe transport